MSLCEVINLNPSEGQRANLMELFGRVTLRQMGDKTTKVDKDWASPKCCSVYGNSKENPLSFQDFLETINPPRTVTVNDVEYTVAVKRLAQSILQNETKLPTPFLESIRVMQDLFTFNDANDELIKLAQALTRTFYLANRNAEDIKLIRTFWGYDSEGSPPLGAYVSYYYGPMYLLNLLSRQNWCPHFAQFGAFVTCFADEKCETDKTVRSKLTFAHMSEAPATTLQQWLSTPSDLSSSTQFAWDLKRPTLQEIENILFQACFTLYTLHVFDLRIFDTATGIPPVFRNPDIFQELWRVFACQKVLGYARYRTLKSVFFVPNYGNLLLFTPFHPEKKGSSLYFHNERTAGGGETVTDILFPLRSFIRALTALVVAWKEPSNLKDEIPQVNVTSSNVPFEFKEMETPTKMLVFQKEQILKYLAAFTTNVEQMEKDAKAATATRPTTTGDYSQVWQIYDTILTTNFPRFQRVSETSKQTLDDLILVGDFGYNPKTKLKVTPFVREVIYLRIPTTEELSGRATRPPPAGTKAPSLWPLPLMEVKDRPEDLVVNPDVRSLATLLEDFKGRSGGIGDGLLLHDMRNKLNKFLVEGLGDQYATLISDRYLVDATDLPLRKQLRTYGVSFSTFFDSTFNREKVVPDSNWVSLAKLRDQFAGAGDYLRGRNKFIKKALGEILASDKPGDLSRFLNTLMLLSYLQGFQPKGGAGAGTTVPKDVEQIKANWIKDWAKLVGVSEDDLKQSLENVRKTAGLSETMRNELNHTLAEINKSLARSRGTLAGKGHDQGFGEKVKLQQQEGYGKLEKARLAAIQQAAVLGLSEDESTLSLKDRVAMKREELRRLEEELLTVK